MQHLYGDRLAADEEAQKKLMETTRGIVRKLVRLMGTSTLLVSACQH